MIHHISTAKQKVNNEHSKGNRLYAHMALNPTPQHKNPPHRGRPLAAEPTYRYRRHRHAINGDEPLLSVLLFALPMYRLLFMVLILPTVLRGASVCSDISIPNSYQLGLSLQLLLPGKLPDFSKNPSAYGVVGSMPIGTGDSIQLQVQYASAEKFTLYLIETNYRLLLPTPFLTVFALAGAHFLHYSLEVNSHGAFGGNLGFGLLLPMAGSFHVSLALKTYLQSQPIVSVGGGFSFLL